MAKLKTFDNYTDNGRHLPVPEAARDALHAAGEERVRQIRLFVVASTKAEAMTTMETAGFRTPRPNDLRVGAGNDLEALNAAGALLPGAVYVLPMDHFTGSPVVRLDASGATLIGRLGEHDFEAS